jgi:hypothetical protein
MAAIYDAVECSAMEDHNNEEEENEDAAKAAEADKESMEYTEKRYINTV